MTLKIISTTDMHSQIENVDLDFRALAADLLIDNGDFFIGNLFAVYCYLHYEVSPLVQLANQIGYDVMVVGNHDLDYGLAWLQRQVQALDAAYLCANLFDPHGERVFPAYTVHEVEGTGQVLVVGLLTGALSQLTKPQWVNDSIVTPPVTALRELLDELTREGLVYDHLCVAYHGGIVQDPATGRWTYYPSYEDQAYDLMDQFPELDTLICGHQHFVNAAVHPNGVAMVQPGSHGRYYGYQEYDQGQLIANEVRPTTELPASQAQFFQPYLAEYRAWLQQAIDPADFMAYLQETYPADLYCIDLGSELTIQGLSERLLPPFPVSRYAIEGWRLQSLLADLTQSQSTLQLSFDPTQLEADRHYAVLATPGLLPIYRLRDNLLTPILEDYLIDHRSRADR